MDVQRQDAKSWIRLDDTVIKRVHSDEVKIDVKDLGGGAEGDAEEEGWEEVNGGGSGGSGAGSGGQRWGGGPGGRDGKVAYILFYQKL